MFSQSKYNETLREVDAPLFLKHLQEHGFEYVLPVFGLKKKTKMHILWHKSKGILCGVNLYDGSFNNCNMLFEAQTPDWKSISNANGVLSSYTPEINEIYPVWGNWRADIASRPNNFNEWCARWGEGTKFLPVWKTDRHLLSIPFGLCHLSDREEEKRLKELVNKLPQEVKDAISSAIK